MLLFLTSDTRGLFRIQYGTYVPQGSNVRINLDRTIAPSLMSASFPSHLGLSPSTACHTLRYATEPDVQRRGTGKPVQSGDVAGWAVVQLS